MFYPLLTKINDNCYRLIEIFSNYFSPDFNGDLFNPEWKDYLSFPSAGWINFWSSFTDTSLKDFVLDIVDEVEKQTNPLHEDNQAEFDLIINQIKDDTFIGSFYILFDDTLPLILSYMKGSQVLFTFKTAGVSTDIFNIPPKTISLDMSWYLPFKSYGDMVISGFMWLGYIWLLVKRSPDIIHGVGLITEHYMAPDEPDFTTHENIVVDDNGQVKSYSTVTKYKNGDVTTQKHKVGD